VNNLEHYNHSGVLVKTEIIAHEAMSMAENSSAMSIGTLPSNALTDNFFLVHNVGSLAIMNMSGVSQSLPISIDHTAAGLSNFSLDNDAEFNKLIQPLGDDKFLLIQTGNEATTSSPIGDTILGQVFSIESDANGLVSSLTELGNPFSIDRGETQDRNIDVQQINDDEFVLVYSAKSDTVTSTETLKGMNGQNVRAQLINLNDGLVGDYLRVISPTDTAGIENDEANPLVTKLSNGDIGMIWNGYGIYNDDGSYSHEIYFQTLARSSFDILSTDNAQNALTRLDTALQTINSQRAELGSLSNRLDHIIANNTNASTNTKASLGRIQDADFAAETTKLAKSKILEQSSTAMLAQANASVYEVLTLIPD
jgi:flagellin-like hook-associated protein FlgL